ncbi:MAG: hypothetical protein INQ03_08140 [Candidatus Heimdallarchaeota archaeon]|nr:hypothetical protein [Candidatus Heimdallarchaeota archaeon]
MINTAKYLFGRSELPKTVFVYAGAYSAARSNAFLEIFEESTEITGEWIPHSYCIHKNEEYMVIFNIFGGSLTLDMLQLMKKVGVERAIFVGLMYSKYLDVGTQVLVKDVYDRAGIMTLDSDSDLVSQKEERIERQRLAYEHMQIPVKYATIVSVPAVFHNIPSVMKFIENDYIEGLELEMSTFYYFALKIGLEAYAFQVVSDNPQHSLLNREKTLRELRIEGRNLAGRVALKMIETL